MHLMAACMANSAEFTHIPTIMISEDTDLHLFVIFELDFALARNVSLNYPVSAIVRDFDGKSVGATDSNHEAK
jgi:hypothetical protein